MPVTTNRVEQLREHIKWYTAVLDKQWDLHAMFHYAWGTDDEKKDREAWRWILEEGYPRLAEEGYTPDDPPFLWAKEDNRRTDINALEGAV